jgi:beta-lactamase superfamily II metal-dependent hydrolase
MSSRARLALLFAALCAVASVLAAGDLRIHTIDVGWGGSVLVQGPDGTTVLLEAGEANRGSDSVVPYLRRIGVRPENGLDYTIAGHQHCDHVGGLDEVINAGYDVHLKNYDNGSTYTSGCVTQWKAAAATTTAGAPVSMPAGTVIQLGGGATLTCVARNGSIIGGGTIAVSDENDRSIVLLLKYGGFDYLWAGDLGGGSDSCTGRSTSQKNIETSVIQAISPGGASPLISSGGIDVLHVNHHGSESSTNPTYFNAARPAVAIISVGDGANTGWDFPRIKVVDGVLLAGASCVTAPAAFVLQTEEGNPSGLDMSRSGYSVGDITITTNGVSAFTVDADGLVHQGVNERTSAGLPRTFSLDDPVTNKRRRAVRHR